MAPYLGRNRVRQHTTYVGNIQSTQRYDKYYDLTADLIKRGDFPVMRTTRGEGMYRKAPSSGEDKNGRKTFFGIEACRTIPPAEHSALSLTNRYSGRRLDGKAGEGALYVASLSGVLREHAYYETRPKPPLVYAPQDAIGRILKAGDVDRAQQFITGELAGSAVEVLFHLYEPQRVFQLADLRSSSLFAIFSRYLSDPAARKRYEISTDTPIDFLVSAIVSPHDYSASRGMADAISDLRRSMSVDGVCASSARGESDSGLVTGLAGDAEGAIQVLFGAPQTRIVSLDPVGSYRSFKEMAAAADLKKKQRDRAAGDSRHP